MYSYRIKIINPSKKTTFVIRDLHRFHGKFDSIISMKVKIIEEFKELVPQTLEFHVGYFLGKQSTKYWIMCEEDLNAMYKSLDEDGKDNVLLWCDGKPTSQDSETQAVTTTRKRKAAADHLVDKRQERMDDCDDIFKRLKEKHGSNYTNPQLRLWARMIEAGNHESTDDPPKIPAITGAIPKKKKDTFAEVLSNAAVTLAQAIKPTDITVSGASSSLVVNQTPPPKPLQTTSNVLSGNGGNGISPGRTTELRIKKLQELRELQQLLEENVISKEEFNEQKTLVLNSLRKLIH